MNKKITISIVSAIILFCNGLFAQPELFPKVKEKFLQDTASFEMFQALAVMWVL